MVVDIVDSAVVDIGPMSYSLSVQQVRQFACRTHHRNVRQGRFACHSSYRILLMGQLLVHSYYDHKWYKKRFRSAPAYDRQDMGALVAEEEPSALSEPVHLMLSRNAYKMPLQVSLPHYNGDKRSLTPVH